MHSVTSKMIDTVRQEAQYDACVKKLLSEKIILAWILKECVSEFRNYSISRIIKDCIENEPTVSVTAVDQDELDYSEDSAYNDSIIEGMNVEDTSIKEGSVYYDIRFSAIVPDTKEPVQLIINIEAQKDDKTGYPIIKRAVYYVSRMISAQKNTIFFKSHYEKIRKVYSIWIQMNVDEKKSNTITRYRITEEQVIGNVPEDESNYDLLTVMMLRLGSAEQAVDKPILKPKDKKMILEKDFNIPMSMSISKEANVMCNLGEGIREKAFEQATQETRIDTVINLMKSLKLSAEEAISAMGVPDEDREYLLDIIARKLTVK